MVTYPDTHLTSEHLAAFGVVIQAFVRADHLIQAAIAGVMKVNPAPVAVLIAGMSYSARRDALLALLEVTALPPKQAEMTKGYLADIHKHSKLRNWIAHSHWTQGSREGSVKPLQMRTWEEI
jgi:hypothetical protein